MYDVICNHSSKFLQRSKAQVDKTKLKEIEDEDRRLAQIIQEQEKLKLRKAKQKKKQQLEERRLQVRSLDKSGLIVGYNIGTF